MPMPEQIAEQSIREYEARLKHIDEVLDKAEAAAARDTDVKQGVAEIKQEREKINDYVEGLKQKSPQEFMDTAGPMVMWEILAEKLEHLVERIKKTDK